MWVQVYDIPRGFLSESILRSVGAALGEFVKADTNTFDGVWKPCVRIRVILNVEKPLKRRMKIRREGDNWSWLNFKYERLGIFCFVCGILGHSERDCNVVYQNPDKVIGKAYGVWLRAPSKNVTKFNAGAKWLRGSSDINNPWVNTNKQGDSSTTVHGGKQAQERFMEVDGMVHENLGNSVGVEIKSREFNVQERRDVIGSKEIQKQPIGEQGIENMESDKIVIDPKRKRVEENVDGIKEGREDGLIFENQTTGSKKG